MTTTVCCRVIDAGKIGKLIAKKMLAPAEGAQRKYHLNFENNYLLRGVVHSLSENGFLAPKRRS